MRLTNQHYFARKSKAAKGRIKHLLLYKENKNQLNSCFLSSFTPRRHRNESTGWQTSSLPNIILLPVECHVVTFWQQGNNIKSTHRWEHLKNPPKPKCQRDKCEMKLAWYWNNSFQWHFNLEKMRQHRNEIRKYQEYHQSKTFDLGPRLCGFKSRTTPGLSLTFWNRYSVG